MLRASELGGGNTVTLRCAVLCFHHIVAIHFESAMTNSKIPTLSQSFHVRHFGLEMCVFKTYFGAALTLSLVESELDAALSPLR